MKKAQSKKGGKKSLLTYALLPVLSAIVGGAALYLIQILLKTAFGLYLSAAVVVILLAAAVLTAKSAARRADKLQAEHRGALQHLQSILDAIPFPVHATDANMKWTYMNRAFETLLVNQGAIASRESAYGMPCSTAAANICGTENCGICQLRGGVKESYFDWCGMQCKQETASLTDENGLEAGYVEVVTDLSSFIVKKDYDAVHINRLSDNLDRLAAGNFELNVAVDEPGEYCQESFAAFTQINKHLDGMKTAIEHMILDIDKLTGAAVEGKLQERADIEAHSGEYRNVVAGVNRTLDAILTPLSVAFECVKSLSEGKSADLIENTFSGDFAAIIDQLNLLRRRFKVLISESVRLADAAKKGDLTARGDVSQLEGGFVSVIDGFNQTLDSLLQPINEAIAVLHSLSVNDLTTEMQGQYSGRMVDFAASINEVRSRLISIEKVFIDIAAGETTLLDRFRSVGKRSENDRLLPSVVAMMEAVRSLITESASLAEAAQIGDFSRRGDANRYAGGFRQIIEGMNRTFEEVEQPLGEVTEVLQKVSKGDLTVSMTGEYSGLFGEIKDAMNGTVESIRQVLEEIEISAAQVASGSKEVAQGSQSLSQGATEQASSIEELTASITQIASQTRQNAENAASANSIAESAKLDAEKGNEQMQSMLRSMEEINESSANISKIIKAIDDIAFQTNILALNAAVEAARAGQYGKGFAVVAEEVRNLAARSASAAKETSTLIEGSMEKTEAGTKIANETARALKKINEGIGKTAALVSEISRSSNEQATGIAQIDQGVEQVSLVVQTNSATSEESAAASAELSGQAEVLRQLVGRFSLSR